MSNLIQQSQLPQVAVDQIIGLYNQGQLEQTVSLAANLAQQYPNALILYDILGAAYMGLKNADKTIESYKKALQLNPNHTDAYNNMGMALYDQGKFYEAVTSYQKALKIEPDFADAHYNLGNAFKEAGNLKKAIESYKASLAINPKDTEVLLNYGDALKSYGDFDEAIVSYKKALLENPNSADVQIKLTELLREKENTDKLCDLLSIKKSSSGNYAQSYFELGCQLQKNGELKMAILYFDRCLVIDPNYAEAYIFTGSIHQQQNEFEAAISVFYRLLKVQPDNPEVYFYIGAAHQMTGQLEKAMNAYEKALKINPDFADVHLNIGSCYLQWGDPEKAIHKFKKVLRIQPDNAQAYNNLGNAFEAQGALSLAIDSFEKAIKVQPDLAEAFSNLGNVLKNKGDLSAAIDGHSQAIKIKPDYADAHNNLGVALKDNGEIGAAINSYKQALKIRPDYAEAHQNLSFAFLNTGRLKEGLDEYEWRWKTSEFLSKKRHFSQPLWDGVKNLKGKGILLWGEQGPQDMTIWSSCLPYLSSLAGHCILECPEKLIPLYARSFPDVEVRAEKINCCNSRDDFDFHLPLGSLFRHFIPKISRDTKVNAFLAPDPARINFWKVRLNSLGMGPFVGISWKSPVMEPARLPNYTQISDWSPVLSLPDITFINLQSTEFADDLNKIQNELGVKVHHFDDLDHYDNLDDVAALSAALDIVVSVSTAVSAIGAGVGTPTKLVAWRQSPWNNLLLAPRGPFVDAFERNTWEPWDEVFNAIAQDITKYQETGCST